MLLDICGLSEFFCSPDFSPLEPRRKGMERRQGHMGLQVALRGMGHTVLGGLCTVALRDIVRFLRATEELSCLPGAIN